jgi:hypothetical protein
MGMECRDQSEIVFITPRPPRQKPEAKPSMRADGSLFPKPEGKQISFCKPMSPMRMNYIVIVNQEPLASTIPRGAPAAVCHDVTHLTSKADS